MRRNVFRDAAEPLLSVYNCDTAFTDFRGKSTLITIVPGEDNRKRENKI
jgi:hypothetical protein